MSVPDPSACPARDPLRSGRSDAGAGGRSHRLGLLVVAGPGEAGEAWMEDLRDSLAAGTEVFLYLIDRGVLHLVAGGLPDPPPEHLRLHACAFGARRYGVPLTGPAVFSGLTVLRNIVIGCAAFRTVPAPAPERSSVATGPTPSSAPPAPDGFRPLFGRSAAGPRVEGAGLPPGGSSGGIVVRVRHDPRTSHLPVEGLRIAAGMTIGPEPLTVWLDPPAAPLPDLPEEEVVDGDRRDAYLDILARRGGSVLSGPADAVGEPGPVARAWRLLTI